MAILKAEVPDSAAESGMVLTREERDLLCLRLWADGEVYEPGWTSSEIFRERRAYADLFRVLGWSPDAAEDAETFTLPLTDELVWFNERIIQDSLPEVCRTARREMLELGVGADDAAEFREWGVLEDLLERIDAHTAVLGAPIQPPFLRELRNMSGMTQIRLADTIGVELKTLRCWEQGKERIPDDYVLTLSRFFEVSSRFLLTAGAA